METRGGRSAVLHCMQKQHMLKHQRLTQSLPANPAPPTTGPDIDTSIPTNTNGVPTPPQMPWHGLFYLGWAATPDRGIAVGGLVLPPALHIVVQLHRATVAVQSGLALYVAHLPNRWKLKAKQLPKAIWRPTQLSLPHPMVTVRHVSCCPTCVVLFDTCRAVAGVVISQSMCLDASTFRTAPKTRSNAERAISRWVCRSVHSSANVEGREDQHANRPPAHMGHGLGRGPAPSAGRGRPSGCGGCTTASPAPWGRSVRCRWPRSAAPGHRPGDPPAHRRGRGRPDKEQRLGFCRGRSWRRKGRTQHRPPTSPP